MSLLPSKLLSLRPPNPIPRFSYSHRELAYPRSQTLQILCAKRAGKRRYPSEKKKLKLKKKEILADVKKTNKFEGFWRLSKLGVPVSEDPGKDFLGVSDGLLQVIAKVIEFPVISVFLLFLVSGKM